jgi:hypothetical protein
MHASESCARMDVIGCPKRPRASKLDLLNAA